MTTLKEEFDQLEIGIGTRHDALTLYPLVRREPPPAPEPAYLLLDDAL